MTTRAIQQVPQATMNSTTEVTFSHVGRPWLQRQVDYRTLQPTTMPSGGIEEHAKSIRETQTGQGRVGKEIYNSLRSLEEWALQRNVWNEIEKQRPEIELLLKSHWGVLIRVDWTLTGFDGMGNRHRQPAGVFVYGGGATWNEAARNAPPILRGASDVTNWVWITPLGAEPVSLDAQEQSSEDAVKLPLSNKAPVQLQKKLTVNTPGDKYEQEAERVAEQVMRMPEPGVHRQCACGKSSTESECSECKKKKQEATGSLKRVASSPVGGIAAPPIVNSVLSSPGFALPKETRSFMESRFGQDFSQVRVHTDMLSQTSAQQVSARAYTSGQHIVFGPGQYAPHSAEGHHLLAHELVHTLQQTEGDSRIQRQAALPEYGPPRKSRQPQLGPVPLPCEDATSSPAMTVSNLLFGQDESQLNAVQILEIEAEVAVWHGSPEKAGIRVDGYASEEGNAEHNRLLSCNRAIAVAAELISPTFGSEGVPQSSVEVFAHGKTGEFGADRAANRRAIISTASRRISQPKRPDPLGVISAASAFYVRSTPVPGENKSNVIGKLVYTPMQVRVISRTSGNPRDLWLLVQFDPSDFKQVVNAYDVELNALPEAEREKRIKEHAALVETNPGIGWLAAGAEETSQGAELGTAFGNVALSWEHLIALIDEFDKQYANESVPDRIIRLRKMGEEPDVAADQITQVRNTVQQKNRMERSVGEDWQLLLEAKAVEMPNGEVLDIHHFFLGLEFLAINPRVSEAEYIKDWKPDLDIGESFSAVTWSGDVGAASYEYVAATSDAWEKDAKSRLTDHALDQERLDFYFRERARISDLLGDIDSWGAAGFVPNKAGVNLPQFDSIGGLLRHVYEGKSQTARDYETHVRQNRARGIRNFLAHYGFKSPRTLRMQKDAVAKVEHQTLTFAKTWGRAKADFMRGLERGNQEMTGRFLDWLEKLAITNGVDLLESEPASESGEQSQ